MMDYIETDKMGTQIVDTQYLQSELQRLRAENEALKRDAERYRWLRDGNAYFPEENWITGGDGLDEAIDREMKG